MKIMGQRKRIFIVMFSLFAMLMMSVTAQAAFSVTRSGVTYPTTLKQGSTFAMKGTLKSNTAMQKIVFTIYKSNGNDCLQRYTATPKSTVYNIANASSHLHFDKLANGSYYYRISAYNAKGTKNRVVNRKFTVASSAKTVISKKGVTVPSASIKKGTSFSMKGTISGTAALNKLEFAIYNAKTDKAVQTYTVSKVGKSYDVSKANSKLSFNKLNAGSYYYRISVITTAGKKVSIVNSKFTVSSTASSTSSTTASNIKISNPVPSSAISLTKGRSYGIGGTITSANKLTTVKAELINESGKAVYSKSVSPKTTTYSLSGSALDSAMKFGSLNPGKYSLVVSAVDSKGTRVVLINRSIFINASGSRISIVNPVPSKDVTISKGASYSIGGKITSAYTLTSVNAKLLNAKGSAVYSVTAKPNAKSFTLQNSTIDNKIAFNKLSAGTYYLNIFAKDSTGTVKAVISKKIVVK